MLTQALCLAYLGAGCGESPRDLAAMYYRFDGSRVFCTLGFDSKTRLDNSDIDAALDYARDNQVAAQLYGHRPGVSFSFERLDYILQQANARGLEFMTYPQMLAQREPKGALVLSFDDANYDAWNEARSYFQRVDAKVTFFLTRYHLANEQQRAIAQELRSDGHAIEGHSVDHVNAVDYVEAYGLGDYVRKQVVPSITVLQNDGFPASMFAFPQGATSKDIEDELLKHVAGVRSLVFRYGKPLFYDPCTL